MCFVIGCSLCFLVFLSKLPPSFPYFRHDSERKTLSVVKIDLFCFYFHDKLLISSFMREETSINAKGAPMENFVHDWKSYNFI